MCFSLGSAVDLREEESQETQTGKESLEDNKENAIREKPLSEDILMALGDDPTEDHSEIVILHNTVAKGWLHWFIKGLKTEKKNELMSK